MAQPLRNNECLAQAVLIRPYFISTWPVGFVEECQQLLASFANCFAMQEESTQPLRTFARARSTNLDGPAGLLDLLFPDLDPNEGRLRDVQGQLARPCRRSLFGGLRYVYRT